MLVLIVMMTMMMIGNSDWDRDSEDNWGGDDAVFF